MAVLNGKSILFSATNPEWKARRKAITPAFYKGKLLKLLDIARGSIQKTVDKLNIVAASGEKTKIDMIDEFSRMQICVLLETSFGEDISQTNIDFWEQGKHSKRSIGYALRETFHSLVDRLNSLHMVLFPIFTDKFLTFHERDVVANCNSLRTAIGAIIDRRRADIKAGRKGNNDGDLLGILLSDPLFSTDIDMITDECLTFFFAGSQTSSALTQNLTLHFMLQPIYKDKVLKELDDVIIQPYLADQLANGKYKIGETVTDLNVLDHISWETFEDQVFTGYCINEALRFEPPVYYSSFLCMDQDVEAGGLHIRGGDPFIVSMYHLANNPNEWIEPRKFIPERFDNTSKYWLTPSGKKRNPYSFSPFLAGSRICLGKTFIESIFKMSIPTLFTNFDFFFEEGVDPAKFEMPHNNLAAVSTPK